MAKIYKIFKCKCGCDRFHNEYINKNIHTCSYCGIEYRLKI